MPDLSRILSANAPLTLSSLPRGAQPLVLADLARAAKQRAVFIAPDDAAMRSVAEAARFFAPEVEVLEFPAWDCLPYDRASPALSVSAARLSALFRMQRPSSSSQLIVTTANAVLQRVLTPFRIRESVREFKVGTTIGHDSLAALLTRQGYSRTDTVIDHGEFAVRGSIVDIFPSSLDEGLRLDFFGDELESLRLFDPSTQRSTGRLQDHLLLPASEALIDDESIKRFRSRYRELFGANATQDPLYEAVSDGRRLAGMEHWLPLFEDKIATLFDHLSADDMVVIDAGAVSAAEERLSDITDYHTQRTRIASEKSGSYRPLGKDALYLGQDEFKAALKDATAHRTSVFAEPESTITLDFGFKAARDFAPERARGDNIYEAAAKHFGAITKSGKKALFAAYSTGSRARIASILDEAGAASVIADSWQEAQGLAAKGTIAAMVLPLDTGFASDELEILTEQDVLGDRLVRRKKKRKDSDAFLAELQALTKGDLVVHVEHGIGKYMGLEGVPVGKSQHDCVQLEYKGGDKLFIPVENLEVLSRYGSSEDAVMLDRLGGEAWQKRRAKLKERITAIAGELMKVAAERALKKAPMFQAEDASFNQFVDRFPWEETEDQDAAIADVLRDLESGKPMDRLVCGDVGFGKTEVALRAAFVAAMNGQQVAIVAPTTLLARQHYTNFKERFAGFPLNIGRLSRLVSSKEMTETREGLSSGQVDIIVGTHAILS
ncbi:MAG: CarD family transcriptional regulator, partial [Erythrobacter sp.]|uniref:CarD family transcriptional regulator n=1 Tax=Erythrobacter sp. TaxID=1042 RepID=UPI003299DCF1